MLITKRAQPIVERNNFHTSKETIYVEVVDFKDQAHRLAGPFDDKYGILTISYYPDSISFNDHMRNWRDSMQTSTTYMPVTMREYVESIFENFSVVYQRKKPFGFISDLDFHLMNDMEREGFVKSTSTCGFFFKTAKAKELVLTHLTESQILEWNSICDTKLESYTQEALVEMACAERPYRLLLSGNDDCTWAKSFATKEEALAMIGAISVSLFRAVNEDMVFTN